MNENEALDYILQMICNNEGSIDEIVVKITARKDLQKDYLEMMDILEKDGYVITDRGQMGQGTIRITFKGKRFLRYGGYVQEKKDNDTELRYKNWTTYVLIYGGVAAGLYYICQLLIMAKHFLCNCF